MDKTRNVLKMVTEQSAVVQAGTPETLTDFVTKILVLHLHVVFRRSVKIQEAVQCVAVLQVTAGTRTCVVIMPHVK